MIFKLTPGRENPLKMSAVDEDIERNQDENTEKNCFNLRNVLLVSGSLVALAVVLVLVGTGASAKARSSKSANGDASTSANVNNPLNSSSQSNQTSSSSSDMIIFLHKGQVHALNPSNSKLQSKLLFDKGEISYIRNFQLTKDKKRLYFFHDINYVFDFDTRQITPALNLSEFDGRDLLIKKPYLNTALYVTFTFDGDSLSSSSFIRHIKIEGQTLIKDYPTECPEDLPPYLVGQSLDGTKLLYRCTTAHDYYLKNLDVRGSEDRLILTMEKQNEMQLYLHDPLFSLDGSKMVFYTIGTDHWTWINLNSDNPMEESRPIYFNVCPEYFQQLSLSDDMKKLYFIVNTEDGTGCKLHEIDYNNLFEKDYSDPQSPLDIGQGRLIELGSKN